MKFVKIRTRASAEDVLAMLSDNERTNKGVRFDEKYGKPLFSVKGNAEKLRLKCEYKKGDIKDNAFLDGTVFRGKITERGGVTTVSGVITTAFIFHFFIAVLLGVFVYQCIRLGGFNPTPVFLVAFDIMMYYKEFKKQGLIKRYIERAVRRCEDEIKYE